MHRPARWVPAHRHGGRGPPAGERGPLKHSPPSRARQMTKNILVLEPTINETQGERFMIGVRCRPRSPPFSAAASRSSLRARPRFTRTGGAAFGRHLHAPFAPKNRSEVDFDPGDLHGRYRQQQVSSTFAGTGSRTMSCLLRMR